jgi:hypothetical protein
MLRQQDTKLILHRLGEQDKKLRAIHDEVMKTNHRVSKLEKWQAFIQDGLAILSILVVPIAIYVLNIAVSIGTGMGPRIGVQFWLWRSFGDAEELPTLVS